MPEIQHQESQTESANKKTTTADLLLAAFFGGIFGCVGVAFLAYSGGMWESFPAVGLLCGTPLGIVCGLLIARSKAKKNNAPQ